MVEGQREKTEKISSGINYYVVAFITIGILIYIIGNALEPEIDEELDFYELLSSLGFAAATIFTFIVSKRYWGSTVFGKAYLSLALGYLCYSIGWNLFWVYEIYYQIANPYPYYPDIFLFAFFPFAIYHIRTNFKFFKRNLSQNQKLIIIVIPIITSSIYAFFGIIPVEAEGGLATLRINPLPEYDQTFYKEYFTGLAFVYGTSLTFSSAIVAFQIFRGTVLGSAWGLLLFGILLNAAADIYYYIFELFGDYVRSNPVTGVWVAGAVFVCYALYKHQKVI
jgi:hypothetical protein